MKEIKGNIWDIREFHYRIIPTNGTVTKNGFAVMGRGLALQASNKYKTLKEELGAALLKHGNVPIFFPIYRLITFPVKHNWWEEADIGLISKSTTELFKQIKQDEIYIMPRVGCGNGRLNWGTVRPILADLPDNVIIVDVHG